MGKDAGFTLVEVLIAVFITSIALIALASLAGTAIKATEAGRKRTQAANLATQKLEALKKVPYSKIQTTDTSATAGHIEDLRRPCGNGAACLYLHAHVVYRPARHDCFYVEVEGNIR